MKQIFIESSYESFADFHEGEWYEGLFKISDGSKIHAAVEDFAFHWWGASRAFVLPWLLVGGVFDASKGGGGEVQSKQELWQHYMASDSFKAALWKTAEGGYSSVYYAYENLLVNVLNSNLEQKARVTDREFGSLVSRIFGESLASKLWNNSTVAIAREIRNCLVHRGGKASEKLLSMKPLPRISEGDVLISASDARNLHIELKGRVELLIRNQTNDSSS
jgi:hypothetical protein